MLDRREKTALSLLFGCLSCLMVTSVVNADGRVFVLDLKNSSGSQGLREAERACDSLNARLASLAELRHAVVDCLLPTCTRGWLYGGAVGTTVCNVVGGTLKAVDVRIENATADSSHLDVFCIKDKGVPCGDPPSFPNAHLQGHSGYEMGDELLYVCAPGYVMPSGHRAFSLLCDSCGEWYGLVEICVKDETEGHIDYEDKFSDSYGEADPHNKRPEEAQGEIYEEVHVNPGGTMSQEQQETSFNVKTDEEHRDHHKYPEVVGEVIQTFEGAVEGGEEEERAVEDFVGHPRWEQERREVITVATEATTEAPVSLLSQKHLFWFPSEAFQDEGHPVSTNPVTQTTQRVSGVQSEESKENESQETSQHQRPVDVDDYHHHAGDRDDHDDHDDDDDDQDAPENDQDDPDSLQDEDDHDDRTTHYIPAQREESHDKRDDHYDMGEHEDDHGRIRYDNHDYDDRGEIYDERESYEEQEDVTEELGDHLDVSEEHLDSDDHDDDDDEEQRHHYDPEEVDNDSYTKDHDDDDHDDHDDHDHDDHDDLDHDDHDDHDHDDHDDHDHRDHHDSHEVPDSHEDIDDSHEHVIFSMASDKHHNLTQKGGGGQITTDETWLDGYPVVPAETGNSDSTTGRVRPEDGERGAGSRMTDQPNEVEIREPSPYTAPPEVRESLTTDFALEQDGVEEAWPGRSPAVGPSFDKSHPSDSQSESDTLDYDTQQAAPTEHPLMGDDQSPTGRKGGVNVNNLPGESGERGEMAGEMGGTVCTGEDCPPLTSSNRGPKVAAIIVVVCAIMTAVIVGVWCYRRQQQKSSMYEMNGKGQSQSRQGQQMEMQQKV